jgi:hypothetical protein
MWMLIFTLLPMLGIIYISWHVWVLLPWAPLWKLLVLLLSIGAFMLMFVNFSGIHERLPLWLATVTYEVGTSTLFIMLYLTILFLLLDLGRLFRLVPKALIYHNGLTAAGIAVLMFGIFLYGYLHYKDKKRVEIELTTDKPLAHDYRMVMLSDLHLGYHNRRAELSRWIDLIRAEKPDFIVIAGDIIDKSVRPLIEEDMAAEFRRLDCPIYACLGNHDYFSGTSKARQFYRDANIRLLSDKAVTIDSCITIIGRDDRMNWHRKSLNDLMTASDSLSGKGQGEAYLILLDHQPYQLEQTEQAGIDFQLSGHTHRGQLWPISWITDALYECSWGSYQRGNTHYYVSSGIGIWGGKFRIGTQSEYIVATIKKK